MAGRTKEAARSRSIRRHWQIIGCRKDEIQLYALKAPLIYKVLGV